MDVLEAPTQEDFTVPVRSVIRDRSPISAAELRAAVAEHMGLPSGVAKPTPAGGPSLLERRVGNAAADLVRRGEVEFLPGQVYATAGTIPVGASVLTAVPIPVVIALVCFTSLITALLVG